MRSVLKTTNRRPSGEGLLTDTQAASMTLSSWLTVSELEMWGGSRGISWVSLSYYEVRQMQGYVPSVSCSPLLKPAGKGAEDHVSEMLPGHGAGETVPDCPGC